MSDKYILITGVGNTDPMRDDYDGPIMHITRYYRPEKIYLIFTKQIGENERKWHYNENAIKLLAPECEIISKYIENENPHSYDDLMSIFSELCKNVSLDNPEHKILLNITSGTPQMETTLAMIGIGEPEKYIPVQVPTPERGSNSEKKFFKPGISDVEECFENNCDNLPDAENRCLEPRLINFTTPIIRFQIESLIQNYNYAGALDVYEQNKELFPEKLGLLLEHGKRRLNLEGEKAYKIAKKIQLENELYPSVRKDIVELADYFNCMQVKKARGELNDFVLRVEVLTQYLGIYILEKCMNLKIDDITTMRYKGKTRYLSKDKCERIMPDIDSYLYDNYFFEDEKKAQFTWDNPLNSRVIICLIKYLSKKEKYQRFKLHSEEMFKWAKLCRDLRNSAAHTIVAITAEDITKVYGKTIDKLCVQMESVMRTAFGTESSAKTFKVYQTLNKLCSENFVV